MFNKLGFLWKIPRNLSLSESLCTPVHAGKVKQEPTMYREGPPYQRRGSLQLWQFLVTLLDDPANAHFIAWTGRGMEFKLIEPEEVSLGVSVTQHEFGRAHSFREGGSMAASGRHDGRRRQPRAHSLRTSMIERKNALGMAQDFEPSKPPSRDVLPLASWVSPNSIVNWRPSVQMPETMAHPLLDVRERWRSRACALPAHSLFSRGAQHCCSSCQ